MPAIEYRDVPNGYVYLYEQQGWVVVERGDYVTRMRTASATTSAGSLPVRAQYARSADSVSDGSM